MWGFPVLTILGAVLMLAVLVSTIFTDEFRLTLLTGVPFLLTLSVIYAWRYRKATPSMSKAIE
jgi:L-asparagine transporter-like permease